MACFDKQRKIYQNMQQKHTWLHNNLVEIQFMNLFPKSDLYNSQLTSVCICKQSQKFLFPNNVSLR